MVGLGVLLVWIMCIVSWFVHVITCIKAASWILLLVGAIAFPIGIVHGFGVMLGVF
jgi:hypothetical protein